MPKISVIVPVYNVEDYLEKCIESFIRQTYTDFELILIDDGSKDNSPNILDKYSKLDERIKVVHKENGGVSSARNTGLQLAKGEYITFCDADDYVAETLLENEINYLEKYQVDSVSVKAFLFSEAITDNDGSYKIRMFEELRAKKKFIKEKIHHQFGAWSVWNTLFKKKIIEENNITFLLGHKYAEDFEFVLRYYLHSDSALLLNKQLYYYFDIRENSEMNANRNAIRLNDINKIAFDLEKYYQEVFNDEKYYEIYHEIMYTELFSLLHIKTLDKIRKWDKAIKSEENLSYLKYQFSCFLGNKNYFKEYGFIYGLGRKIVDQYILDNNVELFIIKYCLWYVFTAPLKIYKKMIKEG